MDGSPPNLGLEAQTAEIGGEVVGTRQRSKACSGLKPSRLFFLIPVDLLDVKVGNYPIVLMIAKLPRVCIHIDFQMISEKNLKLRLRPHPGYPAPWPDCIWDSSAGHFFISCHLQFPTSREAH